MNKSQFFEMVKGLNFKPKSVCIFGSEVKLIFGDYQISLVSCKTEENAAKECHKFNRWLAEALETIKPSETSWCPEPNTLEPGHYEAKVKSVNLEDGKITISAEVGEAVLNLPVRTYPVEQENEYPQFMGRFSRIKKKQKSPEKMYVRATLKIMKMYDCFDSAKNPHWSNMSKKQKKQWARKFALEILDSDIYHMAHDLSIDAGFDGLKNNFSQSVFKLRARQQIIDELDAGQVEDSIEENLNCLW